MCVCVVGTCVCVVGTCEGVCTCILIIDTLIIVNLDYVLKVSGPTYHRSISWENSKYGGFLYCTVQFSIRRFL